MKRNVNRLNKAIFFVRGWDYEDTKNILECLKKGTRAAVAKAEYECAIKDFPDLKITSKELIDYYF